MAAVSTPELLLTAEQFGERPDPGYPEELVRGRIVKMPPPRPRHGAACSKADRIFGVFVEEHDLGHVFCNDTGVITERGPDTVRGADVSFYSYARVPKGPLPDHYLDVAPEIVVEVLSPSDRWPKVVQKVGEYLDAGVLFVVLIDDERRSAHLFGADGTTRMLGPDDILSFPELLGDFQVEVRRFFS